MGRKPGRVVDTNVAVTANGLDTHASHSCRSACQCFLQAIAKGRFQLVLDEGFDIMHEYLQHLSLSGQPGIGDQFVKWVHDHQYDPERCERVQLNLDANRGYLEFPDDESLVGFDMSDRKFAASARASQGPTRVLNAVDSDWWDYESALARHGIDVEHVCNDQVATWEQERPR